MRGSFRAACSATAAWALLCGCFLFPGNNTPEPIPIDDEGCDNNHTTFWAPAPEGMEILADSGAADDACNRLSFHSGGGAQGGDVYHIEPGLRFTGDQDLSNLTITWEYRDPDTDDVLGSQGYEVFPGELVEGELGWEYHAQMFIAAEHRGKNVKLVALTELPTEAGTPVLVRAEAAVYIVE